MTASPEPTGFILISGFPLEVFGEPTALGIHPSLPALPPPPAQVTSNLTLLFLAVVIGLRGGEKFTFGFQSVGQKQEDLCSLFLLSPPPPGLIVIEGSVLMN